MSMPSELDVITKFRKRMAQGTLTDDIKITYWVTGGIPSQRVDKEFSLSGSGRTIVSYQDTLQGISPQTISLKTDQAETRELFLQIGGVIDSLTPHSEACFLPDSLVRSITIEVDGEEATFFFNDEKDGQVVPNESMKNQMTTVLQRLKVKLQQLLELREEEGYE